MSSRSRGRPFNRGSSSGRGTSSSSQAFGLPPDRDIMEGLKASPLVTLSKPVAVRGGEDIKVKNLENIGSYNWVNDEEPTIIVPGSPREWRDRPLPYSVPRDTGAMFVDQNSFRVPAHPLLPLFEAVDIMTEDKAEVDTEWNKVDFISDRNGLRKLLRWIADTDGRVKAFRIDMELAGERTVLFNRWEKRTRELFDLSWSSYGFSFERESTTPAEGCVGSTGHHRIIKYDFDGLNIIIRFEVDACLPRSPASNKPKATKTSPNDDVSSLLSRLNVASPTTDASPHTPTTTAAGLKIIRAGTLVPQHPLIEMTTRSETNARNYDWADAYPQLFLSQTPHHFLAVHARGVFSRVEKRALDGAELRGVDARCQANFKRLRRALEGIQELAREYGQRSRLSLVCRDGTLQVYERVSSESCLPESVMRRFEG